MPGYEMFTASEPVAPYSQRELSERLDKIDRSVRTLSVDLHRYLELECEYKIILLRNRELEKINEQLMRYVPTEKEKKNDLMKMRRLRRIEPREPEVEEEWPLPSTINQDDNPYHTPTHLKDYND